MTLCPKCGSPQNVEARVVGARDVACDFCDWKGSSEELVESDGVEVKDPRAFDLLADWIRDVKGAPLTTGLYINGLVPVKIQDAASRNDQPIIAHYLTRIIRTYVAGIMEGVLDPNILEEKGLPVQDIPFLHWFTTHIERDFIRGMIELGIVKGDMNPKNVRYITKLSRHATRKMWSVIMEGLREDERAIGKN